MDGKGTVPISFGGWHLDQPQPGVFWWRSPAGYHYRVGPNGTIRAFDDPRTGQLDQGLWDTDHNGPGPPDRQPADG